MTVVTGLGVRARDSSAGDARVGALRTPVLHKPLASYHLVLASTGLLLAIGLVMVLSSSSVLALTQGRSTYSYFIKQSVAVALGLPLMWLASRTSVRVWRTAATPLLLVSAGLLLLVLVGHVGAAKDGATRSIPLVAGFNIQPSELAKLAMVLWGADLLVRKRKLLREWKHLFVPLLPVAGALGTLVMLEPDMGTTMVVLSVVMALLWVVGTPGHYYGTLVATVGALAGVLAVTETYRLRRLLGFLDPCGSGKHLADGFQACQGLYALSSGGWLGLGLGASREKWQGGLPNAHTDFVFAIIGEELGLLGTLTVLALFGTLVYSGVRIAKRTTDPFSRLAATGVTAWLAVQSLVNIGAVVGVLPITGIPLPLISYGGSALIPTLVALGMLLSFARAEPGAPAALAQRRNRVLALLGRRAPAPAAARLPHRRPTAVLRPVPGQRRAGSATGASRRPVARGR